MAARDLSAGAPCWIDLNTSDAAVARNFYTEAFGWTAAEPDPDFGGYFMFSAGDIAVAGCMPAMEGSVPDVWTVYLAVDDAAKTAQTATAAGAQVAVPVMEVGDAGSMALLIDPAGAAIGTWQPGQFPGITQHGAAGQPSWFELHTRSYDSVLGFYRDVFGWTTEVAADQPGFRYTMVNHDGNQLAGVMDASGYPPDEPTGWRTYIWVDDADATAARVTELGGSVLEAPTDTPYGRLATITDPNGAIIKLMARNDQMPG